MKAFITTTFALVIFCSAYTQDMLKALQREHGMYRIGIGAQVTDPTGINLQLFRGFFCSNDDTYATNLMWELTSGFENSVFQSSKDYKTGKWMNGGFQTGLGAHYPFANILANGFTVQFYAGAGLQGGNRKYREAGKDLVSDGSFGGNLMLRASLMGRGISIGNGIWFLNIYGEAKLHKQFGEDFNYFRPSLGLVMRKVR